MSETRTKALFQDALEFECDDRQEFLDTACAGDDSLRARVEHLLTAHDEADEFLERPATWMAGVDLSSDAPAEVAGDRVGGFELIEKIGEGGFGSVWRARQDEPVHREVAVKIIKLGMDTAEVVARFERERESLARLDHPNVAKVLEAGSTGDGRPWFAMELVDGEAVTDYCDAHCLGLRERLELFIRVCRAIQYAHHNGIVHRDIKPSNVLVSTRDGEPLPRIIDFGIAKAIHQDEAELTMFTQERRLLGTPEYMSPEQVESWGGDVDARTDVYSLGVLLYELLVGSRPFVARRGGILVHAEVLEQIREGDPVRPSTRIAKALEGDADTVASARGATPPALRRALTGELDWIVLRALDKDRERRYATPAELASDVERYLRDEVVAAGPPSAVYRFRKFARRHRVWLGAASLALVALLAGTVFAVYGLVQARDAAAAEREARELAEVGETRARREADKARLALAKLEELLTAADPRWTRGPDYTVREMLDQFDANLAIRSLDDPEVEARVRTILGQTYRQLGQLDRAGDHLSTALRLRRETLGEEHPLVAASRIDWAWVLHDRGRFTEALAEVEQVVAYWRDRSPTSTDLGVALDARANLLAQMSRFDEALQDLDESRVICEAAYGVDHPDVLRVQSRRAQLLFFSGRVDEAENATREALARFSLVVPEGHPEVLTLRHNLAVMLVQLGRWAEAEPLHRSVLEDRIALHGEEHHQVASSRMNLGWVQYQLGDYESAERQLRLAREGLAVSLGAGHAMVTEAINRIGVVLSKQGRFDEAEELLREAIRRHRQLEGHRLDGRITGMNNLAILLSEHGDSDEAIAVLETALAEARAGLPDPHPSTVGVLLTLAGLSRQRGDLAAEERYLSETIEGGRVVWGVDHPTMQGCEDRLRELRAALERPDGR